MGWVTCQGRASYPRSFFVITAYFGFVQKSCSGCDGRKPADRVGPHSTKLQIGNIVASNEVVDCFLFSRIAKLD
jgi:hypothetical protein